MAHNLLFALFIFEGTKVIETIVIVVYKQGHLVLGFQHSWVKFVRSWIFVGTPRIVQVQGILSRSRSDNGLEIRCKFTLFWNGFRLRHFNNSSGCSRLNTLDYTAVWSGSLTKWLRVRVRARARECLTFFFSLVLLNVMNIFVLVASYE